MQFLSPRFLLFNYWLLTVDPSARQFSPSSLSLDERAHDVADGDVRLLNALGIA